MSSNSLLNDLPVEIFLSIIEMALDPRPMSEYWPSIEQLQCFRLVCKAWNTAIEEEPIFWTVLRSIDEWTWVKKSIERSKGMPLVVEWLYVPYVLGGSFNTSTLGEVLETIGRWRYLELILSSRGWVPPALKAVSAPALKEITISAFENNPNDIESISIFEDGTPELRSISVTGSAVSWTASIFRSVQLTRLSLVMVPVSDIDGLASIIEANSHHLEAITLSHLSAPSSEPVLSQRNTIDLPNLQVLELELRYSLTCAILESITVAPTSRIQITGVAGLGVEPNQLSAIARYLARHRTQASAHASDRLELVLTAWSFGLRTASGSLRVALPLRERIFTSLDAIANTKISFSGPVSLIWPVPGELEYHDLTDFSTTVSDLAHIIPGITFISFNQTPEVILAFLRQLGAERIVNEVFPDLRCIEIKHNPAESFAESVQDVFRVLSQIWKTPPLQLHIVLLGNAASQAVLDFVEKQENVTLKSQPDVAWLH